MSAFRDAVMALSPLAYWRLGESVGPTAYDETANNYDGTYTNTPTLGAASLIPSDTADTAASFASASQEYVDMDYAALRLTTPFTILFWLKDSTAAHQCPFSTMYDWANGGVYINLHGTNKYFTLGTKLNGGGYQSVNGTSDVLDGAAHMLCGTLSGGTGRVYVDSGTEENSGALQTPTYGSQDGPWIARRNPDEYYTNAAIDEVAWFDYALSPAQIQYLYDIANAVKTTEFTCDGCVVKLHYKVSTKALLAAECTDLPTGYDMRFKIVEAGDDTWEDTFTANGSKPCPYTMLYTDDGEGGLGNITVEIQQQKS